VGYGRPQYAKAGAKAVSAAKAPVVGRGDLAPPGSPTLRRGSAGVLVQQLQRCLNKVQRSSLDVDGRFGPRTTAAVRTFQTRTRGLAVDGRYGPKAAAKLKLARSKVG
jgi:peptidoglycan hydrolase-like protein with peptidoglycan-binding domain